MGKLIKFLLILSIIDLSIQRENSIYYNDDPDIYKGRAMKAGETCNYDNCKYPNECKTEDNINACLCDSQYANYPFVGENGKYCTYKRKKQIVAFLWELFLNIGIGHYYIRQVLRGVFKTILMAIPITIFVLGKLRLLKTHFKEGTTGTVMFSIMFIFGVAALIWWIVDIFLFAFNKYRDGDDVPLKHW